MAVTSSEELVTLDEMTGMWFVVIAMRLSLVQ